MEVAFFCVWENPPMDEYIPMTRSGYNKLKAEMQHMESVLMPAIAEKIASARAEGDLSENAEYHAQREAQGLLQAKINLIKSKLSRANIIDPSKLPRDQVSFGATVVVKDPDLGDEEVFTLVGAGEENYNEGRILTDSPLGQALIGRKLGDTVDVPAPKGTYQLEIVEIRFEFVEGE
jgi:transcription elongation factor GreA